MMKLAMTLALCLIGMQAFSQKTYFDPIINIVTTNFHYGEANNNLKDYKRGAWGAQLGATFQGGITERFSFVPEFYFIMKGGKLKKDNPLTINQSTIRLYALELPVLGRLHFGNFYVNSGPYLTYHLFGKMKVKGSANIPEQSTSIVFDNSENAFKRMEAGFQLGGGYMLQVKKSRLALDVKYCYGLTNISNDIERYSRFLNINILLSKPLKTNPLARNKKSVN